MIHFFGNLENTVFAVQTRNKISEENIKKLEWLFGDEPKLEKSVLLTNETDFFVGPHPTMITPWSTNAVEITQNMGIEDILRIEEFQLQNKENQDFDPMLSQKYQKLDQDIFHIDIEPEGILEIDDIAAYNAKEALAM